MEAAAQLFADSSSESGNARACPGHRTLNILIAGPAHRASVTTAIRSNDAGCRAPSFRSSQTASPS